MNSVLEKLRWIKYPVGSDGWICLVDVMGTDSDIVSAARTSYQTGTKQVSDERTLIRYLFRHGHLTPFEMCSCKFLCRVPMDTWRQWVRHRTAKINEYSTRYSVAIDSASTTRDDEWRLQADTNKQGSSGTLSDFPAGYEFRSVPGIAGVPMPLLFADDEPIAYLGTVTPGEYLSNRELDFLCDARDLYNERLRFGVAREQARKDLPLSTYTEAYWKCDLRNIFNFLSLRLDSHAQKEIREYAAAMYDIVKQLFPLAVEAFDDYDSRRGGLLLSAPDITVIHRLVIFVLERMCNFLGLTKDVADEIMKYMLDNEAVLKKWAQGKDYGLCLAKDFDKAIEAVGWPAVGRCRERDECRAKLMRLGLMLPPQEVDKDESELAVARAQAELSG